MPPRTTGCGGRRSGRSRRCAHLERQFAAKPPPSWRRSTRSRAWKVAQMLRAAVPPPADCLPARARAGPAARFRRSRRRAVMLALTDAEPRCCVPFLAGLR